MADALGSIGEEDAEMDSATSISQALILEPRLQGGESGSRRRSAEGSNLERRLQIEISESDDGNGQEADWQRRVAGAGNTSMEGNSESVFENGEEGACGIEQDFEVNLLGEDELVVTENIATLGADMFSPEEFIHWERGGKQKTEVRNYKETNLELVTESKESNPCTEKCSDPSFDDGTGEGGIIEDCSNNGGGRGTTHGGEADGGGRSGGVGGGGGPPLEELLESLSSRQRRVTARARLTLSAASRLLRRKIPQTGHLMLPRRLWMQTVPTQGCEVVLAFSSTADDAAVSWFAGRLKSRLPELILSVKTTTSSARAIYLAASIDGLVKGAEDLRLFKKTKPEFGCGLREVTNAELSMFEGVEDLSTFFTAQERHTIVQYLLDSLRASEDDVGAIVPMRIGEAIVSKWRSAGLIEQVFPLHDHDHLSRLHNSWVQTFFRYQPLDSIHNYFGDKIGVYFAWLGFYTASLTFPAFIGLLFWLSFWGRDQAAEDKAFVALALLNVVWGSVWLEAWKRRSAELVHRWGLPSDLHELLQEPRPQFKGEIRTSPVTGMLEPWFPSWRRNAFRYCVTLPLVVVCLFTAFGVMLFILKLQDMCDGWLEEKGWPGLLNWGPKMLMALTISFFDEAYTRVAVWLNDRENYRTDETYHNHLIVKLALFRFVNSFLALFYIAFYLQDMARLKEQLAALLLMRQIVGNIKESCVPYFMEQLRLAKLSFDLFGALSPTQETTGKPWPGPEEGQTEPGRAQHAEEKADGEVEQCEDDKAGREGTEVRRRLVVDSSNPEGTTPSKGNKDSVNLPRTFSKTRIVSQADVESNMKRYDGTFEDYLEMLIQFGYVMLFSSAFPLAAICAFLNNLIEIRSDAFKLCCVFQRPFPQRVGSIGVWQDAMEFLGLLGIMVNCVLIGQSGQVHRMFPEMTKTQSVLLIIVLEHAMIALKYTISHAIADVPEWVVQEQAKAEFRRRETLRRISSSNSPPTRETSQPPSPRSECDRNRRRST